MANVYHHDTQQWQHVKNLGWLLRHKHDVTALQFAVSRDILGVTSQNVKGVFTVDLVVDGKPMTFQTDFASLRVCRDFCKRPSWSHLKLEVF